MPPARRRRTLPFDIDEFLKSTRTVRAATTYARGATIYAQGDPAGSVCYLQKGHVTMSVVSHAGKEAIVGMLGPGDFFGEGCLSGQKRRMGSAIARSQATVLAIPRRKMVRLLHDQPAMSDRFIAYILARNIRIEEDLVDQLFNSSEKRLARTLLLLACYGQPDASLKVLPAISQETLAEIVGTTRSRVNFFMNKFRKLGFIDYKDGLQVHPSLLSVVARP